MRLHPVTHIVLAVESAVLVVSLPLKQGYVVLSLLLGVTLLVPSRTVNRITWVFLKILVVAAFFLFLLHGVRWYPPGVSTKGITLGLESFIRIAVPVVSMLYLARRIVSEDLFALMTDFRVPPAVILILFRTLWLVPRLMERIDEVVTAQKMRGMRIDNPFRRFRAVIPTLSPIFSSMVDEISRNALVMTARGFLHRGRKTHLHPLHYGWSDVLTITCATVVYLFIWL